jgi:hypothetical protein
MDAFLRAHNDSRVDAPIPSYGIGFTRLSLSAYSSVCRTAYLPLCDYIDVSLGALNAGRVDDSIPAYGTGLYTSLFFSLHIAGSV